MPMAWHLPAGRSGKRHPKLACFWGQSGRRFAKSLILLRKLPKLKNQNFRQDFWTSTLCKVHANGLAPACWLKWETAPKIGLFLRSKWETATACWFHSWTAWCRPFRANQTARREILASMWSFPLQVSAPKTGRETVCYEDLLESP